MGSYTLTLIAPRSRYCECGRVAEYRVGVTQMSAQVAAGRYGHALRPTLDLCGCCYRILIQTEGKDMTNGNIEVAALTLQEVQEQVKKWEAQLVADRAALAAHKQRMGELALRGQAGQAAKELERLELAVSVSEAALEAAKREEEPAKRRRIADDIERLKEELAGVQSEKVKWEAIYNEHHPKAQEAWNRLLDFSRQETNQEYSLTRRELDLKDFDRIHGAMQPQHKNGVTA